MASEFPIEEVPKKSSLDAADTEILAPAEESTLGGDQVVQKRRGRKRRSEVKEGQREEVKKRAAPMASPLDRPSRERKSVERFAALSPRVISATKSVVIHQGSGEKLRDIPNVAFKLSKKKADESLQVLHRVLFGRKANAHFLKRDILQFSGFVWSEDKEKERSKVREKLSKCHKDSLLDFCNILDICILKSAMKKDVLAKLLEFLESPHVTREVILAEKDKKGKKRRRGAKRIIERAPEGTSSDAPRKKKKQDSKGEAKEGLTDPAKADKEEVNDKGDSIDHHDESADDEKSSDEEENNNLLKDKKEDEGNEHEPEPTKKMSVGNGSLQSEQNSPGVRKNSRAASKTALPSPQNVDIEDKPKVPSEDKADFLKDTKGSSKVSATSKKGMQSSKKKIDRDGEMIVSSKSKAGLPKKAGSKMKKDKVDSSKKKVSMRAEAKSVIDSSRSKMDDDKKGKSSTGTTSKDTKGRKNQSAKTDSSNVRKEQVKENNVSVEPNSEQLSAVISEILKEVDFNVATLADIIRQLGAHFDTDLMHRKTEIKQILQEVISNMTDEEEGIDGDDRVAKEGDNI